MPNRIDTAAKKQPVSTGLEMHMANDLMTNADLKHAFVVNYGTEIPASVENIPAPVLDEIRIVELWQGMFENVNDDQNDWITYHNEQYLIACAPTQALTHTTIDKATESAYTQIFKMTETMGFPYLLRTWNYIPHITKISAGENNNYQLFCSGRAYAYNNFPRDHIYPAATVVGTQGKEIKSYCIASKTPGLGVENPQQVSAFLYPPEYSKDPPLFSRALIHRNDTQEIIFVSGTASILGHSTLHEGDVLKQLEVCVDNIRRLIKTAANENQCSAINLADMTQLKVYVKNPGDFTSVRNHLKRIIGGISTTCFIQADLCRDNLLVEIEALAIQATS